MKKLFLVMLSVFMVSSVLFVSNDHVVEAKKEGAAIQYLERNYDFKQIIKQKEIKNVVSENTFTEKMNTVKQEVKPVELESEEMTQENQTELEEKSKIIETQEENIETTTVNDRENSFDASIPTTEEEVTPTINAEEVMEQVTELVETVKNYDYEAKVNEVIDQIYNKVDGVLANSYLYTLGLTGNGKTQKFDQNHFVTATILKSNLGKFSIEKVLEYINDLEEDKGRVTAGIYYYKEDARLIVNRKENYYFDGTMNQYDLNLIASTGALDFVVNYEKIQENGKSYIILNLEFKDIFNFDPKREEDKYLLEGNSFMSFFDKVTKYIDESGIVKDYEWHAYASFKIEAE